MFILYLTFADDGDISVSFTVRVGDGFRREMTGCKEKNNTYIYILHRNHVNYA